MSAIPLADAPSFAPFAQRTFVIRASLATLLVGAVVAALFVSRNPHAQTIVSLPSGSTAIIALDLSASISTDTYSRIGATLSSLARSRGRFGLVLFSDQAYEALPPGTAAANLQPLVRYFQLPKQAAPGFAPTYPANPWTDSFSAGTKIAAGLTLAHTLAVAPGVRRPVVILISDLDDDPDDRSRLRRLLIAYKRDGIPLRLVGLNASSANIAFIRQYAPKTPVVQAGRHTRAGAAAAEPHAAPVGARRTGRAGGRRTCCERALGPAPGMGTRMRKLSFAAALLLLVLAGLAALLASDVRAWQHTVTADPLATSAPVKLPYALAERTLGLENDLAARRAIALFRATAGVQQQLGNGQAQAQRGRAEAALAGIARDPNRARASQAETLLGVLVFTDLAPGTDPFHPATGPAPDQIQEAVLDFQNAVRDDPDNLTAKYDLELVIRTLAAQGTRVGAAQQSGGTSTGKRGAGGGIPGEGY
jgi:hypothetical protein